MSEEKIVLCESDWKAYSRMRDYTEDEICEFEEFLRLGQEGKKRFGCTDASLEDLLEYQRKSGNVRTASARAPRCRCCPELRTPLRSEIDDQPSIPEPIPPGYQVLRRVHVLAVRRRMHAARIPPLVSLDATRLRSLTDMIDRVEQVLDRTSRRNPGVSLLKTIPGVGPRTAEAVVAWVDDPRRFARVKSIGRYFGVVPSQGASGSFNHLGHITREGPATVRWLLAEAAWQAIRRSAPAREVYERVRRLSQPAKRQTRKICGETNEFIASMVAEATYGCRRRPAEFLHHTGVPRAPCWDSQAESCVLALTSSGLRAHDPVIFPVCLQ